MGSGLVQLSWIPILSRGDTQAQEVWMEVSGGGHAVRSGGVFITDTLITGSAM
jgi:hypothetical protein